MNWEIAGRWSSYLPLVLVYGVLGMRILRAVRDPAVSLPDPRLTLGRLAPAFGALLVGALLLRGLFQSFEAWGLPEGLAFENLKLAMIDSAWSARWRWQVAAAAVAALGLCSMRRFPPVGGALVWVGGVGLAALLPMTGHAYGNAPAWIAHSVHILAAGLWIGTLSVVLLAPLGSTGIPRAEVSSIRRRCLGTFAPLAMTCAALLISTGGLLAYLYLPTLDTLWTDPYGQLLLAKVAISLLVVGFGAANYFTMHFRTSSSTDPLPRTVALEVGFAVLVFAATGIFTTTAQPGSD